VKRGTSSASAISRIGHSSLVEDEDGAAIEIDPVEPLEHQRAVFRALDRVVRSDQGRLALVHVRHDFHSMAREAPLVRRTAEREGKEPGPGRPGGLIAVEPAEDPDEYLLRDVLEVTDIDAEAPQ
jgi:hypothetical protein